MLLFVIAFYRMLSHVNMCYRLLSYDVMLLYVIIYCMLLYKLCYRILSPIIF